MVEKDKSSFNKKIVTKEEPTLRVKPKHKKSSSNVDEFAFSDNKFMESD